MGKSTTIRCPKCSWQHDWQAYWACEKCHAIFDTFVTHAYCPFCPNSWTVTICPQCDELSPHEDWYEGGEGGGQIVEKEEAGVPILPVCDN